MSQSIKPSLLDLPTEVRREIFIHYLFLSAPEFKSPQGIQAITLDRPVLVFCDSKADIGSIPLIFGETPENKAPSVGAWPNFYLQQAILDLMLVSKLLYNEVSSCIVSEFALIPPRQIFRFVHWIPFVPNQNAQMFDLIRHLQLRISFSLNEKAIESFLYDEVNAEDVTRFKEFRDWFSGLRSVRLQIGFRGRKLTISVAKKNVIQRIMKCVDVFREIEVLLFVEPGERTEGDTLAYDGRQERAKIVDEIIRECQRKIRGDRHIE